MIHQYLAHAGEVHEEAASQTNSFWIIFLTAVAIGAVLVIVAAVTLSSKKSNKNDKKPD